ncbi:hypothetical protein CAEBREN_18111 [Caenorhabditis brenneri]|uniref:SH3 domain-containing protein n=1 Tax=Caenorhabditis brenneri TaxID=135651 RepID=G0P7P7_CAEBE|nr:hypothetical protein CAEBREN_18111 [Caenorhabditis brenneri]
MSSRTKAVVKFTYEPRLEDELGLTKGEYVYVVEKSTDGWWKGEAPNGSVGWFPSNYVEMLNSSSANSTETREAMYQPPSQEIKQPLVSSTQKIGPFDSTIGLFDSNLDGTFPASPDENSTGPLTVENDQAPPPPDVQEDSDGEVECLYVKGVESRKKSQDKPFNLSTMASHTRINGELLSKDLWKQQPQPQHKHQAALPVAMPAPQTPLQQQPQRLVLQGHQSPLPGIQTAPQATVSASSTSDVTTAPGPSTKTTLHKAQQKAASERARMQSYQQPSAPGIHTMNSRRKDVQKKFDSLLQNNGLVGQFTAPTKDTVKKWRADPFAGLKSPLYVALLQPFLTHSCGYENDLKMLKEMEAFKNQRDGGKRKILAKNIYDAYLRPDAPHEVFLAKKLIDAVVGGSKPRQYDAIMKEVFLAKKLIDAVVGGSKPRQYDAIMKEVNDRLALVHPRDLQKKFELLLLSNGLIGQFTAPTKDTVKKWRADPFAGLKSPLYVALLQPFLTKSCGYEHDLKMLKEMEAFRKQRNVRKREPSAKSIYDAYMRPNAPQEVFLSKKLIDDVVGGLSDPKPSLFNDVLKEVKERIELVHPRFIVTSSFKKLEELYD